MINTDVNQTIYQTDSYTIFFADERLQLHPREYMITPADIYFQQSSVFPVIKQLLNAHTLFFPRQTHSVIGVALDAAGLIAYPSFSYEADFVTTSMPNIGIGVLTADCVPLVMHDSRHHAVAVVHGGWRGCVQQIVNRVCDHMRVHYGTQPSDLEVIIGPCARSCCYEIQTNFMKEYALPYDVPGVIQWNGNRLYCDIALAHVAQLCDRGLPSKACNMDYAACTICNVRYCSYRRQQKQAGRQMTIVSLK